MLNVESVKKNFSEYIRSAATLEKNIKIWNLSTVLNVVKLLRINRIQNSFQIHSLCYFGITVSPWSRADIETSVHKGEHS